ncbi:MAG: xanthine dehydrogenase family protein molybdopterin-binding subunit [bacterium]|nr:xanthine dehydrogenase family protein molybdopterin-binding subunit [bacterium]
MDGPVAIPARFVGRSIPRVNDEAMLRGTVRYLADLPNSLDGVLHAAVIRSPVAHGVLEGLEVDVLAPGARLVGPEELRSRAPGAFPVLWHLAAQHQVATPLLDDRVRYAGQPVAVITAGSAAAAADAAEGVIPLIGELAAVTGPHEALAEGAPQLWDDVQGNLLAACTVGDSTERTEEVFAAADRRLRTRLVIGRLSGAPMEGRGVLAYTEPSGKLVVHTSTQAPHAARDVICAVLGLPQHRVRVAAPAVGGGFGLKDHFYEDEMMVVIAAVVLGRPVLWVESRTESLLATTHARGEICDVEVAFDDDGTLRGLRVDAVRGAGAQCSVFAGGPLFVALGMAPGPYRWDAVRGCGRLAATNTMPTGAYRGFGQTQAALIGERAVELVARALGRHPAEVREQNMIRPTEQPYTTRTQVTYDNGDYAAPLRRARELIEARATDDPPPDDGRLRGVGYASHVQLAGVGPSFLNEILGLRIGGYESAVVRMEPDASVRLYTGVSPHGQGLETTLAQLLADELGVDPADVEVIHSDTDVTPYSAFGTAASRSMALGGGSAVVAARELAGRVRAIAADMLEANPADLTLAARQATVTGTSASVPLAEVAAAAHRGFRLPEGQAPGLTAGYVYDPPSPTFSFSAHACAVAVDPELGGVEITDYVVVLDCGTVVNPVIVQGQVHGGAAQGIGAALSEEVVYDADGQPRTTTLVDYLVPSADMLADFTVELQQTPSPHTPGGMKGMGEGGTNAAFSCVLNAALDALTTAGTPAAETLATPLSPERIWQALRTSG